MSGRVFLITGGGGFVGANLCRRLVENGEEVHLFLRNTTVPWRLADLLNRVRVHEVDLREAERVDRAVEEIRPTIIYHLATHGAYPEQTDGDTILLTNVFGFWNLVQACQRQGFELFVNTGSSSEYGRKAFAMRETDILEPDSYYAVAKAAQSLLSRHCSQASGLPIVTLRLFSVYGPYEEPTRLIPKLMMAALGDQPIDMVAPEIARDFVYVDDVVDTYLDIEHLKTLHGEILNVGTGVQSSLHDVVHTMNALCEAPLDVRWGNMESRPWDSDVWVGDISKAKRLTGCAPRTTLREGLARSLAWYRAHQEMYDGA